MRCLSRCCLSVYVLLLGGSLCWCVWYSVLSILLYMLSCNWLVVVLLKCIGCVFL